MLTRSEILKQWKKLAFAPEHSQLIINTLNAGEIMELAIYKDPTEKNGVLIVCLVDNQNRDESLGKFEVGDGLSILYLKRYKYNLINDIMENSHLLQPNDLQWLLYAINDPKELPKEYKDKVINVSWSITISDADTIQFKQGDVKHNPEPFLYPNESIVAKGDNWTAYRMVWTTYNEPIFKAKSATNVHKS